MGIGTGGNVGIRRLPDGGRLGRAWTAAAMPLFGAEVPLFATVVSLAVFACSTFAATAGLVLVALYLRGEYSEQGAFFSRLLIKTTFFCFLAMGSAWAAHHFARSLHVETEETPVQTKSTIGSRASLLAAFGLTLLLVLPNLGHYPWPAPDELHHLVVARNLAEYGAYASGHPDDELLYFDPYDSVGAPIILPVAAVFKAAGTSLTGARLVIALAYTLLCAFAFALLRRPFGPLPAAFAVLLMTVSFGSVYLARSLYGEVPAMMFLMAGLLLWGKAIETNRPALLALSAGLCFGLAALCKTFILIGAPAFLAAWLYDRLTWRRIAFLPHVLLPGIGLLVLLSAWAAVRFAFRDLTSEPSSALLYYRHSLMFGLDSLGTLSTTLLSQSLPLVVALIAFAVVVPQVFRANYDPPSIVLFLLAILFTFWWIFFTPARIPRYMWYSCAIAGMFSGVFLVQILRGLRRHAFSPNLTAAALAVVAVIVGAGLLRAGEQARLVFLEDRTKPERDLARYMLDLPPEARVATTYWPAQRSVNFLANRHIEVLYEPGMQGMYDTLIYSDRMPPLPPELNERARFDHYIVLSKDNIRETRDD